MLPRPPDLDAWDALVRGDRAGGADRDLLRLWDASAPRPALRAVGEPPEACAKGASERPRTAVEREPEQDEPDPPGCVSPPS